MATPLPTLPPALEVARDPDGVLYFASGSNRAGEIRGLGRAALPLGICALEVLSDARRRLPFRAGELPTHTRGELLDELDAAGVPVFVDSGAFSEIAFGDEGPEVVAPIAPATWQRILDFYLAIAARLGRRAHLVAPDRVGSQSATLERLEAHRWHLEHLQRYSDARILIPLQRGELELASFWRAAIGAAFDARALERLEGRLVAAIPMKKAATRLEDLVAFVRDARPAAVHLLGLGPKSRRWARVVAALRAVDPELEVLADSVMLRSLVGRMNGPGGGPRALTAAVDAVLAEAGPTLRLDRAEVRARAIALLAPHVPPSSTVELELPERTPHDDSPLPRGARPMSARFICSSCRAPSTRGLLPCSACGSRAGFIPIASSPSPAFDPYGLERAQAEGFARGLREVLEREAGADDLGESDAWLVGFLFGTYLRTCDLVEGYRAGAAPLRGIAA